MLVSRIGDSSMSTVPPEYRSNPAWVGEDAYRRGDRPAWVEAQAERIKHEGDFAKRCITNTPVPGDLEEAQRRADLDYSREHAMTANPATPIFGYGEMIRAQRLYMGLSQRELARTIPMDRRTYQRIEGGAEPCPTGFLDTMAELVSTFDREVEDTIDAAEKITLSAKPPVHFKVVADDDPAHIWTRAVIGRAAVESGLILPTTNTDDTEAATA